MTDRTRLQTLLLGALALATTLPTGVRADTCTALDPVSTYITNPVTSDTVQAYTDVLIAQHMSAGGSNSLGLYYWNQFGFTADEWNEGFGFESYWDWTMPLARTLNAFDVLQNSYSRPATSWSDMSPPLLRSAYPYAAQGYSDLDDLRTGCYKDGDMSETTAAATTRTNMWDDFITLWMPFFYRADVVYRAASLLHEANHYRTRQGHTCGDGKDLYWAKDYMLQVACSQPTCPVCSGRGNCPPCPPPDPTCICTGGGRVPVACYRNEVNPKGKISQNWSVYGMHAAWLKTYWFNADTNTNQTMKDLAKYQGLAMTGSGKGGRFCDRESIPDEYLNY